jgi:PKD repeat protein
LNKKVLHLLAFLLFNVAYISAQQNTWTWMKGDAFPNQPGVSGTLGIPSPANKPHARYEACQWTDLQGNFWLYGGGIANARYSDLWRFEPSTGNWTWMHGTQTMNQPAVYGTKGISSPLNTPGGNGFGASTWTDLSGNLWMFGGHDGVNGTFNLLWKFNIALNEWTWIHGDTSAGAFPIHGTKGISSPTNTPGGRCETACTWTDNTGNLWLFGGTYNGAGVCLNDLWKYDPTLNEWTWMSGDNTPNQPGVYGVRGVSNPPNKPGSRWCYTSWKDSTGNLWLFGGIEASSIIGMSYFNDLWKYDIVINEWTWMNGSSSLNQPGAYGTQCLSSTITSPCGRGETRACWKDDCNNFWLFGGRDINFNLYNDLWRYNLITNEWYWTSGSSSVNQSSIFGTQQVPSPSNVPAARMGAVSWKNINGLWLFGGMDYSGNEWNDLWKFSVEDTACGFCSVQPVALFTAPNTICPGTCTDFINQSIGATSYTWNFPGGSPSTSTDASPTSICYNVPGNYDVTLIAANSVSSDTLLLNNYITVYPYPASQGITQSGDTLFANAGAVSYQWYHNGQIIPGATDYFYVATEDGNYNVVATDVNGCEVEAVIFDILAAVTYLSFGEGSGVRLFPNPVEAELIVNIPPAMGSDPVISVYNLLAEKIRMTFKNIHGSGNFSADASELAPGIYYVEVSSGKNLCRRVMMKK